MASDGADDCAGRQTESEIKYTLPAREDFDRLAGTDGFTGHVRVDLLTNHYFDTQELLVSRSMSMLRLRCSTELALLTLKVGSEIETGYFRSLEVEAPLDLTLAQRILRDPKTLDALDLEPLREFRVRFGRLSLLCVGSMENERALYRAGSFLVEVDRMVFPDGTEAYEVEIETEEPDRARAWLEGELRRLGVRAQPSRITKFGRLVEWMRARPRSMRPFR